MKYFWLCFKEQFHTFTSDHDFVLYTHNWRHSHAIYQYFNEWKVCTRVWCMEDHFFSNSLHNFSYSCQNKLSFSKHDDYYGILCTVVMSYMSCVSENQNPFTYFKTCDATVWPLCCSALLKEATCWREPATANTADFFFFSFCFNWFTPLVENGHAEFSSKVQIICILCVRNISLHIQPCLIKSSTYSECILGNVHYRARNMWTLHIWVSWTCDYEFMPAVCCQNSLHSAVRALVATNAGCLVPIIIFWSF